MALNPDIRIITILHKEGDLEAGEEVDSIVDVAECLKILLITLMGSLEMILIILESLAILYNPPHLHTPNSRQKHYSKQVF